MPLVASADGLGEDKRRSDAAKPLSGDGVQCSNCRRALSRRGLFRMRMEATSRTASLFTEGVACMALGMSSTPPGPEQTAADLPLPEVVPLQLIACIDCAPPRLHALAVAVSALGGFVSAQKPYSVIATVCLLFYCSQYMQPSPTSSSTLRAASLGLPSPLQRSSNRR